MGDQRDILRIAVNYYRRGWFVIPAVYMAKRAEVSWIQYRRDKPSLEQVGSWFGDEVNHNLGIICGQVSDGLVVLVFNREEDFAPFFSGEDILTKTPVARSKRGNHVYLKTDQTVTSRIFAGGRFEVKGESTYVVAPPSIHPSGCQYRWLNPEVSDLFFVPNFWEWVTERTRRIGIEIEEPQVEDKLKKHGALRIVPERRRPQWVNEILQGKIPVMQRNVTCFKLACYLFKHYPQQQVVDLLLSWSREHCEQSNDNPFPEKEVLTTIESAYKTVMRRVKNGNKRKTRQDN